MSHYPMIVFANDSRDGAFDALLEPYGECNKEYFTFHKCTEEKFNHLVSLYDGMKDREPSFEAFMKGEGYVLTPDGWGSMYNDNARYDYYTLDGKEYLFDPKKGEEMDDGAYRYRKSQIDFSKYAEDDYTEQDAEDYWDEAMKSDDKKYKDYMLKRYETKEQYVKEIITPYPYCFITPDGVCHAPGFMGWFACDDATAESTTKYIDEWLAYISSDKDDPYVSILDCHI